MKKIVLILTILIIGLFLFGCTTTNNQIQNGFEYQESSDNKTIENQVNYPTGFGEKRLLDLMPKEQGNLIYSENFLELLSSGMISRSQMENLMSTNNICKTYNTTALISYDYLLENEFTNLKQITLTISELDSKELAKNCLDSYLEKMKNLSNNSQEYYIKEININNYPVKAYIWKNYSNEEDIQSIHYSTNNKVISISLGGTGQISTPNLEEFPELFNQLFQTLPPN
jgi:hypothetical protein